MWQSLAACPAAFLYSRASRSVVEAWVSLLRGLPRKSASPLRPGAGGSPEPSFGLKLFMLAHASINVPSTEKCSSDSKGSTFGSTRIAARKARANVAPQQTFTVLGEHR